MITGFPFVSSFDSDARQYIRTSGATDTAEINHFVKGIKALGLWSSMVCWPLRSSQNAGTGSTAYSMGGLGTYNGTLVNGPTWGVDGITFDGNNDYINTNFNPFNVLSNSSNAVGAVSVTAPSGGYRQIIGNEAGGNWTQATGLAHWANNVPTARTYFLNSQIGPTGFIDISPIGMLFSEATNGTTNTAYKNGAVIGTSVPTKSSFANTNFAIGAGAGPGYILYFADMTIAIGIIFNKSLGSTTHAAFYSIYKSTLGQGLGLP